MSFEIIKDKVIKPPRVVLYAPEGVGKTTFGVSTPKPIFIATERGTEHFDVARVNVESLSQVEELLRWLFNNPEEYSSIIIDTIDWLEKIIERDICKEHGVTSIEDKKAFPYAAGYRMVQERIEKLLNILDMMIDKGFAVYLLAHAKIDNFNDPELDEPINRWTLKCHKRTTPIYKEWADAVLFANHDKVIIDGKAKGGFERLIWANHTAARDGKNRFGIPDKTKLDYKELEKYFLGEK